MSELGLIHMDGGIVHMFHRKQMFLIFRKCLSIFLGKQIICHTLYLNILINILWKSGVITVGLMYGDYYKHMKVKYTVCLTYMLGAM